MSYGAWKVPVRGCARARPGHVPSCPPLWSPTPCTLHPASYTLHPTPYTLHPTPCTLHPAPNSLHPAPYTLHPQPYTLHPERRGVGGTTSSLRSMPTRPRTQLPSPDSSDPFTAPRQQPSATVSKLSATVSNCQQSSANHPTRDADEAAHPVALSRQQRPVYCDKGTRFSERPLRPHPANRQEPSESSALPERRRRRRVFGGRHPVTLSRQQ